MHRISLIACLFAGLSWAATPILPSQDPFYVQPTNISRYALGDIVRSREVTSDVNGLSQAGVTLRVKSAYQFMYRSNDSLATPVADVMTFLTPTTGNSSRLLAYSAAYDSANNDCSPSYTLRLGPNSTIGPDIIPIVAALQNGWYVVTSDYEGLKGEFTVGIQSGHGVLDSIKASLTPTARGLTGLSAGAVYAAFGYSGGALATEWASEMASNYAPQLTKFVGAAAGGLTPNVTSVLKTVNRSPFVGLSFSGSHGTALAYPEFNSYMQSALKPALAAEFNEIGSLCEVQAGTQASGKDFFSYFTDGEAILYNPLVRATLTKSGQMGTQGVPRIPLYIYKGAFDQISPLADTTELVNQYCSAGTGARIQYNINLLTDHAIEALVGTPAAYQYISDRFNGKAVPNNCFFFNHGSSNVTSVGDAFDNNSLEALQALLETGNHASH